MLLAEVTVFIISCSFQNGKQILKPYLACVCFCVTGTARNVVPRQRMFAVTIRPVGKKKTRHDDTISIGNWIDEISFKRFPILSKS